MKCFYTIHRLAKIAKAGIHIVTQFVRTIKIGKLNTIIKELKYPPSKKPKMKSWLQGLNFLKIIVGKPKGKENS